MIKHIFKFILIVFLQLTCACAYAFSVVWDDNFSLENTPNVYYDKLKIMPASKFDPSVAEKDLLTLAESYSNESSITYKVYGVEELEIGIFHSLGTFAIRDMFGNYTVGFGNNAPCDIFYKIYYNKIDGKLYLNDKDLGWLECRYENFDYIFKQAGNEPDVNDINPYGVCVSTSSDNDNNTTFENRNCAIMLVQKLELFPGCAPYCYEKISVSIPRGTRFIKISFFNFNNYFDEFGNKNSVDKQVLNSTIFLEHVNLIGKNIVFGEDLPDESVLIPSAEKIKNTSPSKLTGKSKEVKIIKSNKKSPKKELSELESSSVISTTNKRDDIVLLSADSKEIKNEQKKRENSKQETTDKQLGTSMSISVDSAMNKAENLLSGTYEVQNKTSNITKNKRKVKKKKSGKNIHTDKSEKFTLKDSVVLKNSGSVEDEDFDKEIYLKSCTMPLEQSSDNKLLGKTYMVVIVFVCLSSVISFNYVKFKSIIKLIKYTNVFKFAKLKYLRGILKFFRRSTKLD